ncbi:MAG TPA: OsmC family protein [Fimbriimonas sp.]|nr:OsmC family protein [Fimbriimonas sp.]
MKIGAHFQSEFALNKARVASGEIEHGVDVPCKPTGFGSETNGGEFLCLALAACYVNDVYREAERRGIRIEVIQVWAEAEFGGEGEPAKHLSYRVRATAGEVEEGTVRDLLTHVDRVAEIHNTLRMAVAVTLTSVEIRTVWPL